MALDKATLITTLTDILTVVPDSEAKTPAEVATEIADAVDVYVKTGTVTSTVGGGTFPVL